MKHILTGILTAGILIAPTLSRANALAIVNGSFETGSDGDSSHTPIYGWTDAGIDPGFWLANNDSGQALNPDSAYDGSLYLCADRGAGGAGSQPGSSTLSQTVILSASNLILVQSGAATLDLTFAYNAADSNDKGQVDVIFLDGSMSEIGTLGSGELAQTANAAWVLDNLGGNIPGATEAIRIDITTTRASGTATQVSFDGFSGSIEAAPTSIILLSPAGDEIVLTNAFPLDLGAILVDGSSEVDTSSIELMLDGSNLSLDPGDVVKTVSTTTVSHSVSSLPLGTHTLSLIHEGISPAAGPFTNTWSFKVAGPPPICPRWAFEPWVWEDNGNTQASTTDLVAGYKTRNIPVGAVIVDSPWSTSYQSFEWDTARYPDAAQMISDLRADDVRVVLWITGAQNDTCVDTPQNKSPYFDYVVNNGYAVNGGSTYTWWKGTGVHIDFTNPDACDWFGMLLGNMMNMGVDGWKVDQAEASNYLPYPVSTSIGSLSKEEFKPYYYGAVRDQAFQHNPESLIIARPYSHQDGYAASVDKCTIGWGGDYNGSFSGMKAQISDLYASAQTGYGTLAVEIGGYQSTLPSKETLIRYTQLGALMPVMENGGSNGGLAEHLPWYWDTETVDIYRYYATLHSELAPYLFSCSVDSHLQGGSIVKSVDVANEQHGLGDQLFTALITASWTSRDVILPGEGAWIDYWNEEQLYASGSVLSAVPAPLDVLPLYIRAGAILPMNVKTNLTGHGDASAQGMDTIAIYPFGNSSYTYHRASGGGIEYEDVTFMMDEANGTLTVSGSTNVPYRFRIKSFVSPTGVTGADAWTYDAVNKYVIVDKLGSSFSIGMDGVSGYSRMATNFELWQEMYGIAGLPFELDTDVNGLADGMEYYLGSNPTNPLSPDQVFTWSSNYLSATHSFNPLASGVTGAVEWTTDLTASNWTDAGVSYTTNMSASEIEATLGTTTTNQLFLRLKVSH